MLNGERYSRRYALGMLMYVNLTFRSTTVISPLLIMSYIECLLVAPLLLYKMLN